MSLRTRFERDGFVEVPRFLDADALAGLRTALARFQMASLPTLPRKAVYCEVAGDLSTLKQVQHLDRHDPWFAAMLHEGACATLAAALLGEPVEGKNLQFLDKPGGHSLGTPPHQDGFYFMLEPSHAVTLWLAVDEVGLDQGCLRYLPHSHRQGMRPHGASQVLGFSQRILDFGPTDLARERPCPCAPGDLLAHHALTVHRALPNESSRAHRRAIALTYYAASARHDAEAHAAYQRQLAADLAGRSRI